MKRILIILIITSVFGCAEKMKSFPDPQMIVDKSIEASGGDLYRSSNIIFTFRDREYRRYRKAGQQVLMRLTETDTARIEDLLTGSSFERRIDGEIQSLPDSTSLSLAEAVNSVHYFAYLPKGLNDAAVNKTYLGLEKVRDSDYHKIQVTFDQEGEVRILKMFLCIGLMHRPSTRITSRTNTIPMGVGSDSGRPITPEGSEALGSQTTGITSIQALYPFLS